MIGLALGGKTFKLKFGHHGGNHPVKQLTTGKIEITAHNHNFAVDPDSLPQSEVELTHIDLNDNTLEGMRHRNLPLFTRAVPPGSRAGAARLALSVQGFCEDDGGVETVRIAAIAAFIGTLLLAGASATAMTCIAGKSFKVRQASGQVK